MRASLRRRWALFRADPATALRASWGFRSILRRRSNTRCERSVRIVDAGELGDHLFFNVAGIGLDAHVAALVTTRIRHRGLLPYLKASAGDLMRYQPVEYTITVDGRTIQASALVLAFANSKQWGFGAQIAPGADLSDGLSISSSLKAGDSSGT